METLECQRVRMDCDQPRLPAPACVIGPQPPPAARQRTDLSLQSRSCRGGDVKAAMEVSPFRMHSFSAKLLRQSILRLV